MRPSKIVLQDQTPGHAIFSVAYSPFFPGQIAVGGGANFGLVGNGRLSVLSSVALPSRAPGFLKKFDTQETVFDVAWSELHENQAAVGCGDGSLRLFDLMVPDLPIRIFRGHQKEVYSVDWCMTQKNMLATASWDGTVKVWTPERPMPLNDIALPSLRPLCIYAAIFSPHRPSTLATASSDGMCHIYDLRTLSAASANPQAAAQGAPGAKPVLSFAAHPGEALSLDWNKYNPDVLATSSADMTARIHDLRLATQGVGAGAPAPVPTISTARGHQYAVRKVQWSPHSASEMLTASYDMTAKKWVFDGTNAMPVVNHSLHSEFVVGAAYSYFSPGEVATGGWDQKLFLWV